MGLCSRKHRKTGDDTESESNDNESDTDSESESESDLSSDGKQIEEDIDLD